MTFPPLANDGFLRRVDIFDADRAFVAREPLAGDKFVALLQRSLNAWILFVAGGDQQEARRAPGLELPAEHALVESLGFGKIVGMNGKEHQIVGHAMPFLESREFRIPTFDGRF